MAPAEMTNLSQMPVMQPNQVIVLVADASTFPVAPVSYVTWCPQPCQPCPSFQHLQLPALPAPATSHAPASPCQQMGPSTPTPRTEVPSDDSEPPSSRPHRPTASTARRLRRKRAAERAKAANASGAPKVSLEELRTQLCEDPAGTLQQMRGHVWAWSRNDLGCRLVQEALETGSREAAELAVELEGHVLEAAMCPHANYVLQKVVSHLSPSASRFVASELRGSAVRVAKHHFACRILCRLLEFCPFSATSILVDELLVDAAELCTHNFAHHVMESILENGEDRHKKKVAEILLVDPRRYATHRNSSYLIEKVLNYCSQTEQDVLVAKLGRPEMILDLALTQFGRHVASALLRDPRVNSEASMQLIREHQAQLEGTSHGQRFLVDIGLIQPTPMDHWAPRPQSHPRAVRRN
eukprot:CAMPEP_0114665278 /NCGR_PEP_ID=MMETSP0191-20121206/30469_1 /TAXON_ID=126664 /ORGANISM="Sorites sp." /LENGTH=410 /DNA_ID=CAMNT_0001909903 /DNA_START=84 /DNA_END=1316 /DNA_ORIENTATION=+